jgi:hypothetical protein
MPGEHLHELWAEARALLTSVLAPAEKGDDLSCSC